MIEGEGIKYAHLCTNTSKKTRVVFRDSPTLLCSLCHGPEDSLNIVYDEKDEAKVKLFIDNLYFKRLPEPPKLPYWKFFARTFIEVAVLVAIFVLLSKVL